MKELMKYLLFSLGFTLFPLCLLGQHVSINAYKTKDPNHYIDEAGNVRDQNGRVLANESYGDINNYVEVDGNAIYEAHKLRKKLERKGHNGQMTIHTTLPNKQNNGGLSQPITIPFGNSAKQGTFLIQPIQQTQTRPTSYLEVTPLELGDIAIDVKRPVKERLHAVKTLMKKSNRSESQRELQRIARPIGGHAAVNRENDAVRSAAIKGVTDLKFLEKLSKDDLSLRVRREAGIQLKYLKLNGR